MTEVHLGTRMRGPPKPWSRVLKCHYNTDNTRICQVSEVLKTTLKGKKHVCAVKNPRVFVQSQKRRRQVPVTPQRSSELPSLPATRKRLLLRMVVMAPVEAAASYCTGMSSFL